MTFSSLSRESVHPIQTPVTACGQVSERGGKEEKVKPEFWTKVFKLLRFHMPDPATHP
jgi:hypothetical protein